MSYSEIPEWERPVVGRLIDIIIGQGGTISLFDSEEWTVNRSTNQVEILNAIFTADEDTIVAFDQEGRRLGMFYLIYNNGSNYEPMVVISDYSDNDYCDAVYKDLKTEFGVS